MIRNNKVFRANLDDVENLSYGRGAKKKRGTGSRFTCHRLNRDERRVFDQSKRDGFLTVRGTGYRKNRGGSPIWNTFRQRCDALAKPCVVIEKRSDVDRVVIDISTLRIPDDSSIVSFLLETVFSKHPEFYNALISYSIDNSISDTNLAVQNNTTYQPIHWDAVQSNPIWGVNERFLAVKCERGIAKSIALDVLKECESDCFTSLLADAERIVPKTMTPKEVTPTTKDEFVSGPSNNDIDCIDWNDI